MKRTANAEAYSRLVATSARLFAEQGYEKTSIRQIAAEFGVESASLYHYVNSKEDLLLQIAQLSLDEAMEAMRPVAEQGGSPDAKVRSLFRAHLECILTERHKHLVMLTELRSLSEDNYRVVVRKRDDYQTLIDAILMDARDSGVIRSDIPLKNLRLGLLGLMNWTIFWYREDGELSPSSIADQLADMFLDGIATANTKDLQGAAPRQELQGAVTRDWSV